MVFVISPRAIAARRSQALDTVLCGHLAGAVSTAVCSVHSKAKSIMLTTFRFSDCRSLVRNGASLGALRIAIQLKPTEIQLTIKSV